MSELDERVEIQVRQLVGQIMREWGDPRVAPKKAEPSMRAVLLACLAIIAVGLSFAIAVGAVILAARLATGH